MRSLALVIAGCASTIACASPGPLPRTGPVVPTTGDMRGTPDPLMSVLNAPPAAAVVENGPQFEPARAPGHTKIRCIAAERAHITISGLPPSVDGRSTSFEVRRFADRTTISLGPSEHDFFEVDGVDTGTKPPIVNELSGKSFEVKAGAVKRVDAARAVPAALAADVLGVVGPFNEVAAVLRPGPASPGPLDARLATLFASQVLGLLSSRPKLGVGTANLLSVREYAGEWLARIEFLAPITWSDREVPRHVMGEALVRMDGFVVSVAGRSVSQVTSNLQDHSENTLYLRCRDAAEEEQ